MAVTLRSVTVGPNTGSSATVSVTTPSDSTAAQAGDVVLVCHCNDFFTAGNMPAPSATGSPTMHAIVTADGGSGAAHIKAYWYEVVTLGAQTITVTETGSADEEKAMVALVLGGVDTTNPVDTSAADADTSATASVAPAVTPNTDDAFLVVVVNSGGGGAATAYDTPAGLTEQTEFHIPSVSTVGMSGVVATAQLSSTDTVGPFTVLANGPAWSAVTIALRAAAGGGEVAGTAATAITFTATAAGTRTVFGAAASPVAFAASASGTRTVSGSAATPVALSAAAAGLTTVFGAAATAIVFAATAVEGVQTVTGTAATSVAFVASASGTRTVTGTAATSAGFAGSASGLRTVLGVAALAVAFVASAVTVETVGVGPAVTVSTPVGRLIQGNPGGRR